MPDLKIPTLNKSYKPTDQEQNMREWVYQRYSQMKDSPERKLMEREWEAGEKAWDQYRHERDEDEWQSNYYIPLTTSVVESVLAEFVDQRLRPMILPRGSEDAGKARVMTHIYNYTWDVADGDMELFHILKGTLIRGTGIAQEYYLKDRRLVRDIINLQNTSKKRNRFEFESKEREVFEFDGCMMEGLSLWDVFVDEKARDFNRGTFKARDVIRRYIMNIRDAKQFFHGPIWDPLDNMRFVKPGGDTNYYQFYKPPEGIDHSEEVEILWYWSRKPEDLLVIVINDVVIRMGPSIFKHKQLPFARAVDVTRLDKFYGKGEPKLLESVQEELNMLRRMTIDRHHLDLDKSFLVPQTTLLDDEDLISRPHAMIQVDDPNSVKALEYGDIPSSVQLTQRAINEDSIRVTGVDDRFQALQKAPSTATEAAILKESTLKRIRMKIMLLTEGFLKDISRQRVANIMQFYSQPKLERIVGEKGTQEYKSEVARLANQGLIQRVDGEIYKKKYREMRLDKKEISFDERGQLMERDSSGFSFFELKPEFFMPSADGGYDVKFEAGSTLPISKPLMQSKATEMYDRVIGIAQAAGYDIGKLTDWYVEVNDYNPDDFKSQEQVSGEMVAEQRIKLATDLASKENQEVVSGNPIPAMGTPYAPPVHTEIHIAFLNSPTMQQASQEQFDMLVKHVTGEIMAQNVRNGGQGLPGQAGAEQAAPEGMNPGGAMGDIMPDRIQGAPQVATGMPQGPAR